MKVKSTIMLTALRLDCFSLIHFHTNTVTCATYNTIQLLDLVTVLAQCRLNGYVFE